MRNSYMDADITLYNLNETFLRIDCQNVILYELYDHFAIFVKNHQFMPAFEAGLWDGRVSSVDVKKRTVYKGLVGKIIDWAKVKGYRLNIDPAVWAFVPEQEFTNAHVFKFYEKIKAPYLPHDSQADAVSNAITNARSITLAPTANGKSYIVHGLCSFYRTVKRQRILIVIDRSQLIKQLKKDLVDEYGAGEFMRVVTVYDKVEPKDCDVFITTWQSIYKKPESWFENFGVIIGDELHKFKAKSLIEMMGKCGHIKYRHGLTGTLDNDSEADRLTLIGLFGEPLRVATLRELIDKGIVADPTIYAITVVHSDASQKELKRRIAEYRKARLAQNKKVLATDLYQIEIEFLENMDIRNDLIAKIAHKAAGNTIIAFNKEEHGLRIYESLKLKYGMISEPVDDKKIKSLVLPEDEEKSLFFANGGIDVDKRVAMSELVNKLKSSKLVASLGTFSTGISIKNLNSLVIACFLKSEITVPQLLGRMLRITDFKTTADVYDVGDKFGEGNNSAYKAFGERLGIYAKDSLRVIHITINL